MFGRVRKVQYIYISGPIYNIIISIGARVLVEVRVWLRTEAASDVLAADIWGRKQRRKEEEENMARSRIYIHNLNPL